MTGPQRSDPTTYETILSGDINDIGNPNDNSYHVVTGADNATLDGFTITDGNANGPSPDNLGGGIFCNGASPTISSCVIRDNRADYVGGGMCNYNGSSPTISNCVIRDNRADYLGGGMCNYNGSSPTVTNCFFIDNKSADGAGMGNYGSYNHSSHPTLTNCVFSGNYATYDGGGIRNTALSSVTLINCTFSKNHAELGSGGLDDGSAYSPMTNCIFWGNTGAYDSVQLQQIYGLPVVNYSCIQDDNPNDANIPFGGADNNNIDDDPCFADANDPNGMDGILGTRDDGLRLMADSPCIDAADGDVAPSFDILGVIRLDIVDVNNTGTGEPPYVDIGAYEYKALKPLYAGGSKKSDGTGVLVYERLPSDTSWHAISDEGDFGAADAILSLCYHDGNIYAGTKAASGEAAVYRWDGGTDWTKVSNDNWGNDTITYVLSLIEYKGDLYAGTKPVNLYRYDAEDDWSKISQNADPNYDLSNWDGIKCLYEWDGVLYLGDSYHDLIAHYAPPTIPTLTYIYGSGGSCIWDFQLYHDRLYASAYVGVIYRSEEDDGSSWDEWTDLGSDNVWELEEYQDKLFIAAGYKLYETEGETPGASIWEIPSADRQYGEEIISMLSTGYYLYIGTGGEFSEAGGTYSPYQTGNVYVYDGLNTEKISDGLDTSGIQCLLMVNP